MNGGAPGYQPGASLTRMLEKEIRLMFTILIHLIVVGLIVGLIWWAVDYVPVPNPLAKIIKIVSIVIGFLIIILDLLALTGVDTGIPGLVR